jgi:hypothetical protein
VQEDRRPNGIEKLLNFVYEHLNACYGFKNLYKAKENYSPTAWVPGYYAWLPRMPDPQMLYADGPHPEPPGPRRLCPRVFPPAPPKDGGGKGGGNRKTRGKGKNGGKGGWISG